MLLEKIKLKNFRCYLGECEINFATDSDRNITLIHGENGVGKTALLNAIRWTFFETLTKNFKQPESLLNLSAKRNGVKNCHVEIEFEENSRKFCLKRTYYSETKKSKLQLWEIKENGTYSAAIDHPKAFIESIIPSEIAEYFFFQGEGSSAIDDKNKSGTLGPAIRNILGFKVAQNLISDLKSLIRDVRKRIANEDKSGQSERLVKIVERIEDGLEAARNTKNSLKVKIKDCEQELEAVDSELKKIESRDLKKLLSERNSAEQSVNAAKSKRDKLKQQKIVAIKTFGHAIFGSDFASQSLAFIDESLISGKIPEPYNEQFIQQILDEGSCICGACLDLGSEGYARVTAMLDKAANPVLQNRLNGIRAQITDIDTLNRIAPDRIKNLVEQTDENEKLIAKYEKQIKILNDDIKSIPIDEIKNLQFRRQNTTAKLKELLQRQGRNDLELEEFEDNLKRHKSQLESFSYASTIVDRLKLKQNFMQTMIDEIENHLKTQESAMQVHVGQEVNKILDEFSRHDYKIRISDDTNFQITLVNKNEESVGQGDGLNLLLNLTITAALIKFSSERRNVKDFILKSATVAPLVIDAPFGVLDDTYRNVVVKNLPNFANQLVFFVSSSQWNDDMDAMVKSKIGKEYCLVMEESAAQGNKKLDVVRIRGKEYILSKYGQANSKTSIMEINL